MARRETTTQQCAIATAEMAEKSVRPVGESVCPPAADHRDTADHHQQPLHDYEAQFFRFTPETCMMRICGAFQESLTDVLLLVEGALVSQRFKSNNTAAEAGDGEEARLQMARECSQKLQAFLDKRFQRLEARIKTTLTNNCFTIPPNVLLAEDQQHSNYPQDLQEVLSLELSIAELTRAYEAEVCGRRLLLEELEEQKETQELLDGILRWVEETTHMTSEDGATGRFQSSIRQVKEAIKKLEDCVAEICHKAPRSALQNIL